MRSTSLVERLLSRMEVEPSLAGDLFEQHHGGRSHLWLWRQALLAVVVGNFTTISSHKVLALRAVGITSVVWAVCGSISLPIIKALTWPYGVRVSNYLLTSGHETLYGYFIRYHLDDVPWALAQCAAFAAGAWAVRRTDRLHQVAMVLLSTTWVYIYLLGKMAWFFSVTPSVSYGFPLILVFCLAAPCMLIAGLAEKKTISTSPA
jgi:hypothetical protein